jgi:hypothetical protein
MKRLIDFYFENLKHIPLWWGRREFAKGHVPNANNLIFDEEQVVTAYKKNQKSTIEIVLYKKTPN